MFQQAASGEAADRRARPSSEIAPDSPSRLSIVIPALNEENAIAQTVARCLAARSHIISETDVESVELIVVSDGSTDRTEELARSFPEVTVLAFDKNRGYGAAIKCGWAHATGDLLAFLDADGTCDPLRFANLVGDMQRAQADVVLGSRNGPESQMPWIRTVGNRLFAWLLMALSLRTVADTASGMRVVRRAALPHLYPLPDGLHFTPAMSARVLLEGRLKLRETPMPYAERIGRSKLSVVRDGVRFLVIILQAAVTFRPARPLLGIALLCVLGSFVMGLYPAIHYLTSFRVEEWVVYRILLSSLLATIAAFLTCAAVVSDRIASAVHGRWAATKTSSLLHRLFTTRMRTVALVLLWAGAVAIVLPGLVEYAQTTHVYMHWSRAVLSSLLVVIGVVLSITGFLLRMMDLIEAQQDSRSGVRPPDRIKHAADSEGFAEPALTSPVGAET